MGKASGNQGILADKDIFNGNLEGWVGSVIFNKKKSMQTRYIVIGKLWCDGRYLEILRELGVTEVPRAHCLVFNI